ncbi:MAG: hypothetical protein HEP71_05660 [Roseivirga sp.]|nr:hypothetical protein [Roseivirga sp.]
MTATLSHKTFRIGFTLVAVLMIAGLALYVTGAIVGDDWVLPWHIVPTHLKSPLFLEYFQVDGQPYGINLDQVITWQHYQTGNEYQELPWLNSLLFWGLFISLVIISVTLTYLSRFWYLLCTSLMLFILMQLKINELGFFTEYISYALLLVFGGSTYFFQNIKPHYSLFIRSISILVIYAAFAGTIGLFSGVVAPVSITLSFGLYTPLLLCVLFMFFVGADNIYSLFNIATKNAPNGKNGLIHFMSIGLIYIAVLALLFLHKIGRVNLDLYLVDSYLVFVLAIVSGYYCLSDKLGAVEEPLPVDLIKKWLYPSLAGLSLIIIGYAELSGNDSLSELLQKAILLTQLGGGAVFYVYACINFAPSLLTNESVAGRFFHGVRAPLLTGRVLHVVAIVALFYYLDKQPYFQAKAARYNALATLSESLDNEVLTLQYYKQSQFYDFYGFRSNYALAMADKADYNRLEVVKKLSSALTRDDQGKARVALANFHSEQNQLFNKLLTLKEDNSGNQRVSNNLGVAHYEFQQYDSAFLAFGNADQSSAVTEANLRAMDYFTLNSGDRALPTVREENDLRVLANVQAIANKLDLSLNKDIALSKDTILLRENLFFLYNQSLRPSTNHEQIIESLDYYLSSTRNSDIRDFLMLGRAIRHYQGGEVNKAFTDLNQLAALYSNNRGQYVYLMGLWAAQQGALTDALQYLNDVESSGFAPESVAMLKELIANGRVPTAPRATGWQDSEMSALSKEEKIAELKRHAVKNTFNIPLTLKAIETLKEEGVATQELYELLRQAVSINRYSLELTEAYAFQSIESGLAAFGKSALIALTGFVNEEALQEVLAEFDQRADAWRNRPLGDV